MRIPRRIPRAPKEKRPLYEEIHTKTCKSCHSEKPLVAFQFVKTAFDHRSTKCLVCLGETPVVIPPVEEKPKAPVSEKQKAYNRQIRKRLQAESKALRLAEIMRRGNACEDCKRTFPACCYDFHHRDPQSKEIQPTLVFRTAYSPELREAELAKCDMLCACCHRIRHEEMRQNHAT